LPLIIDVGSGGLVSTPKEIPSLRYGDAQLETELCAWIDSLSAARQEADA
jgi:hypothetical protein